MAKRYGAPYIGSKNNIAEEVINFLPAGKRLCDLFGGGGAITDCALTYGRNKYKTVLYNDVDPVVVDYVKGAFSGNYDIDKNVPDSITREDFQTLKTVRGDVAYLWSFGNNGIDYVWGVEKEEVKLAAFDMLTRKTCHERYLSYKKFLEVLKRHIPLDGNIKVFERIQLIEYDERIKSLEQTVPENLRERIEFSNISYLEYEYLDGDVVYCDIPYEASNAKAKYMGFDAETFYDWAATRPYPVYISSYEINDDRFTGHPISKRRQLLSKTTDDTRVEMIYMNETAVAEKKQEMFIF